MQSDKYNWKHLITIAWECDYNNRLVCHANCCYGLVVGMVEFDPPIYMWTQGGDSSKNTHYAGPDHAVPTPIHRLPAHE